MNIIAEPIPADVEKLLIDLQNAEAYIRKLAAEDIGRLTTSNEQIVRALIAVWELDDNLYVRHAAQEALLNPEISR